MDLLSSHAAQLEAVARRLLEKEMISQHDLVEIIGPRPWKMPESYSAFVEAGNAGKPKAEKPGAAAPPPHAEGEAEWPIPGGPAPAV